MDFGNILDQFGRMTPNVDPSLTQTGTVSTKPKVNWAGVLADALAGLAGQGPIYAPMAERRRAEQTAFERGEQQYQRRRTDELSDADAAFQRQVKLLDYKRTHPDDQLSQYMDLAGIPTEKRPALYQQKIDALTAPPMMSAQGFDEQGNPVMRFFPRAQPKPSGPPPAAIAYLRANPNQAAAFEQKYGPGAASQYLGGPTPPASGGFR